MYISKKFDKDIKAAHNCENLQVMVNYIQTCELFKKLGYLKKGKDE